MELFIDDGNLDEIGELIDTYPCDGVTTNPTILSKAGNPDPMDQLHKIRAAIGDDRTLFAQAVSRDADGMVREAEHLVAELGKNTVVKVPVTAEGIKAIAVLAQEGLSICGTVVYGIMPGFLAAKAGARYLAPYVNRLDCLGYDGVAIASKLNQVVKASGYGAKVLGASFKNAQQVIELAAAGIESVTVAPEVFHKMAGSVNIEGATDDFVRDFESLTAPGKTMLDF